MYFSFSVIFSFLVIFQVLQCAFLIFHLLQWFRHFSSSQVDVSHFPWFSVSCHIPCATVDISKLSNFFSFPLLISRPKVCISHFPRFSIFSPYSRSYSVHFSFFSFFSDFVIFQLVKWVFLIFHDFQFSWHIPSPTVDNSKFSTFFSFPRLISSPKVCISHILWFSVFSPYSRSYSVHFSFFTFFSDFVIFQGVKWLFLIFHDFQFSCHIPCPIVDISKFSNFFSFPRNISRPKVCIFHFLWFSVFSPYSWSYCVHFSFFTFFSDFVIFQVVKWMFLIFHDFQFSCHIPRPTVDISKFSTLFSFPRHISLLKVCTSHFSWFSLFSPYSRSYSVHFSFFTFFSDFVIVQADKWMFLFFHDFQFSCHIPCPTGDISKFSTFFSFPHHISCPKVCISQFP